MKLLLRLLIIFFSMQSIHADIMYEATHFGDPDSNDYVEGRATAINENNMITGYLYLADNRHLFIGNEKGEFTVVYTADFCYPSGINDRGDIVGSLVERDITEGSGYNESNFLWLAEEGIFKKFPWKNYLPTSSSLNAINNDRIFVATLGSGNGFQGTGAIFKDSCHKKLFEISKANHSFRHKFTHFSICDVSNTGYCILNCCTFPVKNGLPQRIPPSTYIINTADMQISCIGEGSSIELNDHMDVLCRIKIMGKYEYCIWSKNNLVKIENMTPRAFNNHLEVVGKDVNNQAVIWKNGTTSKLIDLVCMDKLDLLRIEDVSGINDQGAISCTGTIKNNGKEKRIPLILIPIQ